MTQRRRPQISSEADLARVIGASESYAIDDWLQARCEFADGFDDDGGEQAFRRVIFFHGNSVHAQYTIGDRNALNAARSGWVVDLRAPIQRPSAAPAAHSEVV